MKLSFLYAVTISIVAVAINPSGASDVYYASDPDFPIKAVIGFDVPRHLNISQFCDLDGKLCSGYLTSGTLCKGEGVFQCVHPLGDSDRYRYVYRGQLLNYRFHGRGMEIDLDSDYVYNGDYDNGQRHGRASIHYNNGDFYIGEVSFEKLDGEGEGYIDGEFVRGTFKGGKLVSGLKLIPNEKYSKGFFNDAGELHGNDGREFRLSEDGRLYRYAHGRFIDGELYGYGEGLFFGDETAYYFGDWKYYEPHGNGTILWDNGASYAGGFKEGEKNGAGEDIEVLHETEQMGSVAIHREGTWVDDERHGRLKTTTYPDGTQAEEIWENGERKDREE